MPFLEAPAPRTTQLRLTAICAFALASWFSPAKQAHAQSLIPPEALRQIKAATVLIEVTSPLTASTGSGFVAETLEPPGKNEEQALIVTNAHVIRGYATAGTHITCVFYSGTPRQAEYRATVVASDPYRDLAFLAVRGKELPEPLRIGDDVHLTETLPVFAVGFPFGNSLATSKQRPSLTISRGTITSLRRDDFDRVAVIQVDSGINPGNSGGPVVTKDGALVGIAVAKIKNAEIGFAIPKSQLFRMLRGDVGAVQIDSRPLTDGRQTLQFTIQLVNPKQTVEKVEICWASRKDVPDRIEPNAAGEWNHAAENMLVVPATIQESGRIATATVNLEGVQNGEELVWQVRIRRKSDEPDKFLHGVPFLLAAGTVARGMSIEPKQGARNTPLAIGQESPEQEVPLDRFDIGRFNNPIVAPLPGVATDIDIAGGGRYLVVTLNAEQKVVVYDLKLEKFVLTIQIELDDLVAANSDSIFAISDSVPSRFQIWSLRTMKKTTEGNLPISGLIVAVETGPLAKGPLMVVWSGQVEPGINQLFYTLLRPGSRRSVTLNASRSKPDPSFPYARLRRRLGLHVVSSPDGLSFGMWIPTLDPTGLQVVHTRKGTPPVAFYEHKSVGYVVPMPSGQGVCTERGFFSRDLATELDTLPTFPTTHGDYYLSLKAQQIRICRTRTGKPMIKLPILPEFTATPEQLEQTKIPIYRRLMLIPQYNIFVTMPFSDDRLFIRKVKLDLPQQKKPAKVARKKASLPSKTYRTWRDKSGKYRVIAKLVLLSDTHATLQKKDGTTVDVPIDRLSDSDLKYLERFQ